MRQQTSDTTQKPTGLQYAGVVTPVVKNKLNWLPARNKSCDSMDRSTATSATTDDSRSVATLATEDEREATASALLMVAKVAERESQQYYLKGMVVDGRPRRVPPAVSSSASTCSSSSVPLKKRKKQFDILRRQQQHQTDVGKEACHVSPVSHDNGNPSPDGNRTQSYDSKDLGSSVSSPQGETTQELLDSSKVHSTAQIGAGASLPVSQVLIPHFPTVLHQVLADKKHTVDEKGPIIRWLPDGESWTVENWNSMRKQVLPKFFSDLRDENGSSCGTIDAFLHNIDAWGFEEIKNGPNAGAYRHNVSIAQICITMYCYCCHQSILSKHIAFISPKFIQLFVITAFYQGSTKALCQNATQRQCRRQEGTKDNLAEPQRSRRNGEDDASGTHAGDSRYQKSAKSTSEQASSIRDQRHGDERSRSSSLALFERACSGHSLGRTCRATQRDFPRPCLWNESRSCHERQ